jgi:hypothetical protein
VYDGGIEARQDRSWCGLCGALVYEPPRKNEKATPPRSRPHRRRRFEHPRWEGFS